MSYLTLDEYIDLGFDCCMEDFKLLQTRAETAINLYTQSIYEHTIHFPDDYDFRQKAIKLAMAYQIDYLSKSGILTADDKQSMGSVSIGRTSISYDKGQKAGFGGQQYNLCLDAENALKQAGFSLIVGVDYDR